MHLRICIYGRVKVSTYFHGSAAIKKQLVKGCHIAYRLKPSQLPTDEKKLWHSHNYEVKSGVLTAPGAPEAAEKDLMKVLIGTYGKTWHTWQVDRGDKLPLGIPQLMMAFTKDGQLDPKIAAERDQLYSVSVAAKKAARADIPDARIDPGADGWQKGSAVQLDLKSVSAK